MKRTEIKNEAHLLLILTVGFLLHHQLSALIHIPFKWYGLEVVSITDRTTNTAYAILKQNILIMSSSCCLKIVLFCSLVKCYNLITYPKPQKKPGFLLGIHPPTTSDFLKVMKLNILYTILSFLVYLPFCCYDQKAYPHTCLSYEMPLLIGTCFYLGMLVPLSEELFFRGFLIQELRRTTLPKPLIVLMQAIWFGIVHHGSGHDVMLKSLLIGILWGSVQLRYQRLVIPLISHMLINGCFCLLAYWEGVA